MTGWESNPRWSCDTGLTVQTFRPLKQPVNVNLFFKNKKPKLFSLGLTFIILLTLEHYNIKPMGIPLPHNVVPLRLLIFNVIVVIFFLYILVFKIVFLSIF